MWANIPTKRGLGPHPFMLPHTWFASLHKDRPEAFADSVHGPAGAPLAFWTCMAYTPFVKSHPKLTREDLPCTIPLGFYGDAGSFSHQDSLYVFTWNSLVGTGATMAKRYLTACLKKSDIVPGTLDAVFRILAWSFNILLDGKWPTVLWNGMPVQSPRGDLAGKLKGCLCQIRGDWEFYCTVFSLPKWSMADNMCWMCQASANGPSPSQTFLQQHHGELRSEPTSHTSKSFAMLESHCPSCSRKLLGCDWRRSALMSCTPAIRGSLRM